LWQTFSRPSKLLILEGTFDISEVSLCFLVGFWWPYCCLFSKHSCSVHFCLMNLVMISQTAQWRIFEFEVGERSLASENERLTVFVCYHRAVRFLNYTRCVKSVLWLLINVLFCPFMFKGFEWAQIGEGVRWLTLVSWADFRRNDRCLLAFNSEAFCISSLLKERTVYVENRST